MSGWLITNHSASITLSSVTKRRKINRKRQKFKTPWCSIKGMHKKDWFDSRNFDIHLIQSLFRLIFLILKKGKEAIYDLKEPFTPNAFFIHCFLHFHWFSICKLIRQMYLTIVLAYFAMSRA